MANPADPSISYCLFWYWVGKMSAFDYWSLFGFYLNAFVSFSKLPSLKKSHLACDFVLSLCNFRCLQTWNSTLVSWAPKIFLIDHFGFRLHRVLTMVHVLRSVNHKNNQLGHCIGVLCSLDPTKLTKTDNSELTQVEYHFKTSQIGFSLTIQKFSN